jgi:hypothetical protein
MSDGGKKAHRSITKAHSPDRRIHITSSGVEVHNRITRNSQTLSPHDIHRLTNGGGMKKFLEQCGISPESSDALTAAMKIYELLCAPKLLEVRLKEYCAGLVYRIEKNNDGEISLLVEPGMVAFVSAIVGLPAVTIAEMPIAEAQRTLRNREGDPEYIRLHNLAVEAGSPTTTIELDQSRMFVQGEMTPEQMQSLQSQAGENIAVHPFTLLGYAVQQACNVERSIRTDVPDAPLTVEPQLPPVGETPKRALDLIVRTSSEYVVPVKRAVTENQQKFSWPEHIDVCTLAA